MAKPSIPKIDKSQYTFLKRLQDNGFNSPRLLIPEIPAIDARAFAIRLERMELIEPKGPFAYAITVEGKEALIQYEMKSAN